MAKMLHLFFVFSILGWSKTPPSAIFVKSFDKPQGYILHIDSEERLSLYNEQNVWSSVGRQHFRFGSLISGAITQADQFTPLLTAIFYGDLNRVTILDDRLSELTQIDFNTLEPFRDVTHIAMAGGNMLWLFDSYSKKLQKFDYFQQTSLMSSINITESVRAMKSDTEHCWILTDRSLLVFNSQGGLIKKNEMPNYSDLALGNSFVVLFNESGYFLLENASEKPQKIIFDKMLTGWFFLQGQTLYIYDQKTVHEFQLKF
jgi:hypothetical protein